MLLSVFIGIEQCAANVALKVRHHLVKVGFAILRRAVRLFFHAALMRIQKIYALRNVQPLSGNACYKSTRLDLRLFPQVTPDLFTRASLQKSIARDKKNQKPASIFVDARKAHT
jgi:hypothetical protein